MNPGSSHKRETQQAQIACDDPHATTKRMRMTLACERCRTKKVKCDFTHPVCHRCEQAKATCSYTGSSTQVDLFNLVQLNETIKTLQDTVLSIQRQLHHVGSAVDVIADELKQHRSHSSSTHDDDMKKNDHGNFSAPSTEVVVPGLKSKWALSLTPQGLRIDTGIISIQDLYDTLLSGIAQFQNVNESRVASDAAIPQPSTSRINKSDTAFLSTTTSPVLSSCINKTVVVKHYPLYKSRDITFPLYSAWESNQTSTPKTRVPLLDKDRRQKLLDLYSQCFLCLPLPDMDTFLYQCELGIHPSMFLVNAILSWSARHAAIYHAMFPGQDPNTVGEAYFEEAKRLLRDAFLQPSIDTAHGLLLMYIYSIGKTGPHRAQAESEAYVLLGLATRMCLDLKLHRRCDQPHVSELEREKRRRLFAAAEFMETLCAAHSDKPLLFPDDGVVTVEPPSVMDHEQGERRYRVQFTVYRHQINQISRAIHAATMTTTEPLLSDISTLEQQLKNWYRDLPVYFQLDTQRSWNSTSFREQACLKLNFEYNFQMCQLYSVFLPHAGEPTNAIGLLAQRHCLEAAGAIVNLLECWVQLEQDWCHFTLDTLVMACAVYSNQLRCLDARERAQHPTRHMMRRIAILLRDAPVRHHKYVKTLILRIERQTASLSALSRHPTKEGAEKDGISMEKTIIEEDSSSPLHTPSPTQSPSTAANVTRSEDMQIPGENDQTNLGLDHAMDPSLFVPPPILPVAQSTLHVSPPAIEHHHHSHLHLHPPPHSPHPLSMAHPSPATVTEDWDWFRHALTSTHPAMDVSINDLFRFSDFVYTPIMDDDGTGLSPVDLASTLPMSSWMMDDAQTNPVPFQTTDRFPPLQ